MRDYVLIDAERAQALCREWRQRYCDLVPYYYGQHMPDTEQRWASQPRPEIMSGERRKRVVTPRLWRHKEQA